MKDISGGRRVSSHVSPHRNILGTKNAIQRIVVFVGILAITLILPEFSFAQDNVTSNKPNSGNAEIPDAARELLSAAGEQAAQHNVSKGLQMTAEAVQKFPSIPIVHAYHLAMLFEAKDYITLEQMTPVAVDTALKEEDHETLTYIMELYCEAVLKDVKSFRSLPDRILQLKAAQLALRTVDAYPNDPRLVLAYLQLQRNASYGGWQSSETNSAVLSFVPKAIRQAYAEKRWGVVCALALDVCHAHLCARPPHSAEEIRKIRDSLPLELFDKAAEAASQLDNIRYFGRAYAAKLNVATIDPLSLDLDELDRMMNDFRQHWSTLGVRAFSEADRPVPGLDYYFSIEEKDLARSLCRTGIPSLQAKAVEILQRSSPKKTAKEIELELANDVVHMGKAGMEAVGPIYAKYGIQPPESWQQALRQSSPINWEAKRRGLEKFVQTLKEHVGHTNDDLSKRMVLNMGRRNDIDLFITASLKTDKPLQAVETAEWFQGYALRDLLGTHFAEQSVVPNQPSIRSDQELKKAPLSAPPGEKIASSSLDSSQHRDLIVQQGPIESMAASQTPFYEETLATQSVSALGIAQMQALLDDDTTILYCHMGSYLGYPPLSGFVAVLTKNDVYVNSSHEFVLGSGKNLVDNRMTYGAEERVERFLKAIDDCGKNGFGKTQSSEFDGASRWLYDFLIAPVRDRLKTTRLVIIPCDELLNVPFQLLRDHNGRYLGEDFEITYAPSVTVLELCLKKHAPLGNLAVVLANPALADPAYSLKFAETEADVICQVFNHSQRYTGAGATESALRNVVSDADVIHFASHYMLRTDNPMTSFLALARDNENDGQLTAAEVMQLKTKAQLIVLSACDSGRGENSSAGQEVLGMTRAWMFAGAPSVVVSLWKIDDRATSELMGEFYKNLKTMSRAEALQQAQITMMKKYDNPYYWGAFVLYGDYR